jgi:hypothetical protein
MTASGGGITLKGGNDGDKYIRWSMENKAWWFSENIDISANRSYNINDTLVLNAQQLGPTVKNSSLETVGTIKTGEWEASPIDIRNYTTLEVDKGQFYWDDNKLHLKDYYVRKTGDDIKIGNLTLTDQIDGTADVEFTLKSGKGRKPAMNFLTNGQEYGDRWELASWAPNQYTGRQFFQISKYGLKSFHALCIDGNSGNIGIGGEPKGDYKMYIDGSIRVSKNYEIEGGI